ncbi:ejaculatory bulb-specific protein 3-like [Cydia splendana]|uniref:ejaculatory bulb-specific protein 3-like n=1 Tax=Cydia splendana TaxID=1100963 RepID=UPI00300D019A
MKLLVLIALFSPLVLCYDAKYDSIDVDKVLADETQFTAYINCMLDKGPCTVEHSADFRKLLPEVVATACEKCSDLQKANMRKSVKALQERKPTDFVEFRAKYDPKGEYEQKFAAFIMETK